MSHRVQTFFLLNVVDIVSFWRPNATDTPVSPIPPGYVDPLLPIAWMSRILKLCSEFEDWDRSYVASSFRKKAYRPYAKMAVIILILFYLK